MSHNEAFSIQATTAIQATTEPNPKLLFESESLNADLCLAKISISQHVLERFYHEAARSQQASTKTYGFQMGAVPLEYIKQNFKENFVEHLKEFILKFCAINFLYESIRRQKLVIVGEPRLKEMFLDPNCHALFTFELSTYADLTIHDWKYFPFRAPKRKNYKDLDRQVESFIAAEMERAATFSSDKIVMGDWISFGIELVDDQGNPLIADFMQKFWFKLCDDETESPLRLIFLGKAIGDSFITDHASLQAYFSSTVNTNYIFKITILSVQSGNYLCFEKFKRTFRIKTNKDLHKKLIEVFSYRNDVSQRHAMVEEAFNTLLAKHSMNIPNHLLLRRQKILINSMHDGPDYHVYRAQKSFKENIQKLAFKQCTELIFIDKFALHENIQVSDEDITGYLNLVNRPRIKDFVYFDVPYTKIQGQEAPITLEEIKLACLREKAINYALYHLTKQ